MGDGTLRLVLDTLRARGDDPVGLARRQRDRLAALVTFARRTSPVYRARYRGLPDMVEDPALLPVVDKATLMGEFDDWVTDPAVTESAVQTFVDDPARIGQPFLDRYTVTTTSGTTGTSGLFLLDRTSLAVAGADMLRALTGWLTGRELAHIRGGGRIAMIMATGGHFASAVAAARLRTTPAHTTGRTRRAWVAAGMRVLAAAAADLALFLAFQPVPGGGWPRSVLRYWSSPCMAGAGGPVSAWDSSPGCSSCIRCCRGPGSSSARSGRSRSPSSRRRSSRSPRRRWRACCPAAAVTRPRPCCGSPGRAFAR